MAPPRLGHGLATEVALEVPAGSLAWWGARLERYGVRIDAVETRFGDLVLPLTDVHGMRVALVESAPAIARPFSAVGRQSVPHERQIRGLYGAQIWERREAETAAFLIDALGFRELGARARLDALRLRRAPGRRRHPRTRRRAARRLGRRRRPPSRLVGHRSR